MFNCEHPPALSLSRQEATVTAVGIVGGRLELTLCATPILTVAPIEAAALHVALVRTSGNVFHGYGDERRQCSAPDHHILLVNRPPRAATAGRVRPPRAPTRYEQDAKSVFRDFLRQGSSRAPAR
jgi:hypothetical protein